MNWRWTRVQLSGSPRKRFKKVQKLHRDGIPAENIASELEMSKSLVRQYVEIVEDLAKGAIGEKE